MTLKGIGQVYNIYLFISNSTGNFKLNQLLKIPADSANAF